MIVNCFHQGEVEAQGTPTDLMQSGVNIANSVGSMMDADEEHFCEKSSLYSRSNSALSSDQEDEGENEIENANIKDDFRMEASSKGKITGSVPLKYFSSGTHWSVLVVLLFSFIFVQFLASAADYWVSIWYVISFNIQVNWP